MSELVEFILLEEEDLLMAHTKLDMSCMLRERPPVIPLVKVTHGKLAAQDHHEMCKI